MDRLIHDEYISVQLSQILNKYIVPCKGSKESKKACSCIYLCDIGYTMSFIYGIVPSIPFLPLTPVTTSLKSHLTLGQVKVKKRPLPRQENAGVSPSCPCILSPPGRKQHPSPFPAAPPHHFLPHHFHFHHTLMLISYFLVPLLSITDAIPHPHFRGHDKALWGHDKALWARDDGEPRQGLAPSMGCLQGILG